MVLGRGLFILTSCWFSPTCLVSGDGNLTLVMETQPRALLLDLVQYRACFWKCCHT